jgi:hypothetical protein
MESAPALAGQIQFKTRLAMTKSSVTFLMIERIDQPGLEQPCKRFIPVQMRHFANSD